MSSGSSEAGFAALLLAGGHSRRMGADKAFLPWQGRPMWRHQAELLGALGPERVLISARREQQEGFTREAGPIGPIRPIGHIEGTSKAAAHPPSQWLYDLAPEYSPMEAMADSMRACGTALLVLAVDLPQMREDILRSLVAHWRGTGRGLVYEHEGQAHPLTALYPRAMKGLLEDFVRRRVLRLQALVREAATQGFIDVRPLPSAWVPAFLNTNTPEEWNQARPPHP